MGKRKRKRNKKPIKYFRLISLAVFALLFFIWENYDIHSEWISPENPPIIYASQTHDHLKKIFLKAIGEAEKSIYIATYSLSDESIIQALHKKALENIPITVVHDSKATPWGYKQLKLPIQKKTRSVSGLMHQKILIVDDEKVWIGSANMTSDSLSMHDNLVIGFYSHQLAERIIHDKKEPRNFYLGFQEIEYWGLPEEGKESLQRLVELIDGAQKTVKVAMFTFTHADLANALIRASNRGVETEVVIDHGNARGMCKKNVSHLLENGIRVKLGGGLQLFHHKFLIIDDQTLVNGSTNWTKAAFSRNAECFLVIKNLNDDQKNKLDDLWHIIRATSKKAVLPKNDPVIYRDIFENMPLKEIQIAA